MSAYRFCRTDDIPLLVRAYNECLLPHVPGALPYTDADLKRDIRELGLWCSSCMVAFEADRPVGFVFGCKRPPETLVRAIAVHPDHLRRGHGRHLLTSLSSKLAILGPPRLVAEVAAENAPARALFETCGYREERRYVDLAPVAGASPAASGLVHEVTLDDLRDAGCPPPGEPRAWERTGATLEGRKDRLRGWAVVSAERIEAFLLFTSDAGGASVWSLGAAEGSRGAAALAAVLSELARREGGRVIVPKVGPGEIASERLEAIGCRPGGETLALASEARGG